VDAAVVLHVAVPIEDEEKVGTAGGIRVRVPRAEIKESE
jgi:hypothetical protein